jgi:hypothetical protein
LLPGKQIRWTDACCSGPREAIAYAQEVGGKPPGQGISQNQIKLLSPRERPVRRRQIRYACADQTGARRDLKRDLGRVDRARWSGDAFSAGGNGNIREGVRAEESSACGRNCRNCLWTAA